MRDRNAPPRQETDEASEAWKKVPWKKLEQHVFRIQKRIYQASQRGETRKVEKPQKLLMKSKSAQLLAVRRVTQDNQGKKTAGIDGVKSVSPRQRLVMANQLHPKHWKDQKARPVRRVWIPKPGKKDEQRPLGIPVMIERAQQTLVKLALEPAWEAKVEPNSYGFRPGRSCHDAIGAICFGIGQKPKWGFDADIKGCFDKINPKAVLTKLQTYPQVRHIVKAWLESGVLDGVDFSPTETGTPQGGAISPLLANMALHGIEEAASHVCSRKKGKPHLIRDADEFVILHANKAMLDKAVAAVTELLEGMGLWLNPKKTRITHTLSAYEGNVGFDFLGFSIRQFPVGKTHSGKNRQGKMLGHKTFITPSKEAVRRHTQKIKLLARKHRSAPQNAVIRVLNPVIRGWTNYYRWVLCCEAFKACDFNTFRQLFRWGQARHSGKSKRWVYDKYWMRVEEALRFGKQVKDREGNPKIVYVRHHTDTHSQDYVKVRGQVSPYDGNLIYWTQRLKQHPLVKSEKAKLLALQKGQCPRCGLYFQDGDILETDHIIPTALGGKDDRNNKWVYHRHCHDEKTAEDLARIAQHKAAGINHN